MLLAFAELDQYWVGPPEGNGWLRTRLPIAFAFDKLPWVTRTELKYPIAHAMLSRVLASLTLDGTRMFPFQVQHYWTPHSCRAFLPSATMILEFPKPQRDFLGGWNPQASDRYARTARRAITVMQKAVVRAIHSRKTDPLSEQDLSEHFEQFLNEQRLPQASVVQCISSLRPQFSPREIPEPIEVSEDVVQSSSD